MCRNEGRWWASLVLSLLVNVAAEAPPAEGNGPLKSPAFFQQDSTLTGAVPANTEWQPVDTSAGGAAAVPYDAHLSPRPTIGSPYVPHTASPQTVPLHPYGFSFLSDSELPLTGAVPSSLVGGGRSSQISSTASDAISGSRSSRHGTHKSSFVDGAHHTRRNNVHNDDGLYSGLGDAGAFSGNLGEFPGGVFSSPVPSDDFFTFPSPPPDGYAFQQPPSFHTQPDASFWKYSAWGRVNARPNEVILLTDVDDTLWSSGGWRVADYPIGGVDKEYARGDAYPGITALQFVLAAGRHATAAADPPMQPVNFLLPSCPHPGFVSPLLELCPAVPPHQPRAASSSFFPGISPTPAGTRSSSGATPAGEVDVPSIEDLFISTPPSGSVTTQHLPAAAAVHLPSGSHFFPVAQNSPSSPPTFCGASSFSPVTGLQPPNPAQCRAPLVLPPAVGLLTARLSTPFFKGWTRSPSFYHDIDWQLEHGARMIYGPNIFAGAWTHGFENNVELMRDAIGGQHSRGRAKVQGFRSALRAGLRPAAQVAASFAAARLQMAAEDSTTGAAGGGRRHLAPFSGSSTSAWTGSGPTNRHRGGAGRNKFSSGGDDMFARHSVGGLTYTHGAQRTSGAGGAVTTGEQSLMRPVPDLGSLTTAENIQAAGMPVSTKDGSPTSESSPGSSPGRKNEESQLIAEFVQAVHFSKPTVCNRAVPVLFGDTGEKDLEVAASVAALFPDRLAAVFSHFVFADRDAEKSKSSVRPETAVPRGCVPFTFK